MKCGSNTAELRPFEGFQTKGDFLYIPFLWLNACLQTWLPMLLIDDGSPAMLAEYPSCKPTRNE